VNTYLYIVQPKAGDHYWSSTSWVEWLGYKVQSIYIGQPLFWLYAGAHNY